MISQKIQPVEFKSTRLAIADEIVQRAPEITIETIGIERQTDRMGNDYCKCEG
jgi:hypothetical protein